MLYEITLLTPQGLQITDRVDLPLDPELTWQEFCGAEAFTQWLQDRASWRVMDITPEDMIRVEPETVEITVEDSVEVTVEETVDELLCVEPVEVTVPVSVRDTESAGQWIDSWSGRTTKNTEFTRWMALAKRNGISDLTFKSRVYKLGWDYGRAATTQQGRQGVKQK